MTVLDKVPFISFLSKVTHVKEGRGGERTGTNTHPLTPCFLLELGGQVYLKDVLDKDQLDHLSFRIK